MANRRRREADKTRENIERDKDEQIESGENDNDRTPQIACFQEEDELEREVRENL